MSRTPAFVALLLYLALGGVVRAEDNEPTFQSKTLSEWLNVLQNDPAPRRRQAALIIAERIGSRRPRQLVPAVLTALRDDSEDKVREGAAALLGRLCARALKENSEAFRFDSIRDSLATALKGDRSARVREAAASALGQMGAEAHGAVSTLAAALKDASRATRTAAADALRRLGPDAEDALPDLQRVLGDPAADRETRVQCALAIGRLGIDGLNALSTLKEVLADARAPADVRKAVCESLQLLGKDAAGAAPVLGQTLTAPSSDVALRRAAAVTLDALGAESRPALPSLKKALKDGDQFVRCHAMHALGQYGKELGPHTRDVVTALLEGMDDNVLEVRLAAIETLGTLGAGGLGADAAAVSARLQEATRDSQKAISEAAAAALKKIEAR